MEPVTILCRLISLAKIIVPLAICVGVSLSSLATPDAEIRGHIVLVVTAVDYEFNSVTSLLQHARRFTLSGRQVATGEYNGMRLAVIRAGWGKAQASGATALGVKAFAPRTVIMAGVGGGIDTSIVTSGDVVIVESTFSTISGSSQNLSWKSGRLRRRWNNRTRLPTSRPRQT
jgi:hypothetical protein